MAYTDNTTGGRLILDSGTPYPRRIDIVEACEVGDVLGYSSGWKRALATTATAIQGRFVALEAGQSGASVAVSMNPVVGGYASATPGSYVYVAEATLYGETTQTAPLTTGDCNTIIGVALSATEVQFFLNARVDAVIA